MTRARCFARPIRTLCRLAAIAAVAIAAGLPPAALAADKALRCYRARDTVACLVAIAREKLKRVADANDRADAIGDLLYALAATHGDDASLMKEARTLAGDRSVRPAKQMDLLYSIDMRESVAAPPAQESYAAALRRFAALESELKGGALAELYVNACAIIGWDDPFRERWLDFAERVCTPERLKAAKSGGVANEALLLAMMPVAMTLAEDRDGFETSADEALTWLRAAESAAAKSKDADAKDFVASVGVLMHTTNSTCLDAFDEPDAADAEIDRAVRSLRRLEARRGISDRTTPARRQVIESLFDAGRDEEAAKLLRGLLARVDADADGRKIRLSEQIAILLLAARLEYHLEAERAQDEVPEGHIRM